MSYKITSHKVNKKFEAPEEIFIVFTDLHGNSGRFYGLKSGFGHCFMLYRFGQDWLVVDPLFCGINHARIQDMTRSEMIDLLVCQACKIVVLEQAFATGFNYHKVLVRILGKIFGGQFFMVSFGVFSCVTLVKRALNIRRPWLITPFGLYKFFIRTNKENY